MLVRHANCLDAIKIARLHRESLKTGLISKLPLMYIKKFYTNLCSSSDFLILLIENGNNLIGAVVVAENGFGQSKVMLPVLGRFYYFLRFIKKSLHMLLLKGSYNVRTLPPNVEFLFVSETARNTGSGRELINALKTHFNVLTVSTRDHPDNSAIIFYRKVGFMPKDVHFIARKRYVSLVWRKF